MQRVCVVSSKELIDFRALNAKFIVFQYGGKNKNKPIPIFYMSSWNCKTTHKIIALRNRLYEIGISDVCLVSLNFQE